MLRRVLLFCFIYSVVFECGASVSFITKCKADDSKCLKSSANVVVPLFAKGLPEYGVEQLDPFIIKKTVDSSIPGLKFLMKNVKVEGLKDCTIESLYRDKKKSKIGGKVLCQVLVNGQYEMQGKLLVLNVQGTGDIRVFLNKILITFDTDVGDKIGKDGVTYWDLKRFTHSFILVGESELEFKNLKTGSEVLDRAANDVIKNNSNEIVTELGPEVIKTIVIRVIENIRRFFHHVPPADLALD